MLILLIEHAWHQLSLVTLMKRFHHITREESHTLHKPISIDSAQWLIFDTYFPYTDFFQISSVLLDRLLKYACLSGHHKPCPMVNISLLLPKHHNPDFLMELQTWMFKRLQNKLSKLFLPWSSISIKATTPGGHSWYLTRFYVSHF